MTGTHDIIEAVAGALACDIKSFGGQFPLSEAEIDYLSANWGALDSVDAIWAAMDRVWEETGAGYSPAEAEALSIFYASPVWLLNGIFTELDPESAQHRIDIASYVSTLGASKLADYGGGFGSFARKLKAMHPEHRVHVIEPYPTALALALAEKAGVGYLPEIPDDVDIVTAQDVLEHVTDPLGLFAELLAPLRPGGHVITANCFQPVIKCHFPGAYHFNFTFRRIAPLLGCDFVGTVPGAPHAEVFRKNSIEPNWARARRWERISEAAFPLLKVAQYAKLMFRARN